MLLLLARSGTCKPETEAWIMHKAWLWGFFFNFFYFLNFKIFNSYMRSQTWTPLPPPSRLWGLSRASTLVQVKSHRSVVYVLRKRAELQTTRKNVMKLPTQWASLVAQWKRICLQCRRPGFDPWVGKIPWRMKWKPTPIFLPGKSHGQGSLAGYSPWGSQRVGQDWMTKQLTPTQ